MKKKNKANVRRVRVRLSNGAGFYIKWAFVSNEYNPITDSTNHRFWVKR